MELHQIYVICDKLEKFVPSTACPRFPSSQSLSHIISINTMITSTNSSQPLKEQIAWIAKWPHMVICFRTAVFVQR